MRKYLLLSFFICILILLLSSCITTKRYKNDWMNKKYTTKECTLDNDIIELPYILVPDSEKEKYVALLKDVSFCEIDKTEYEMIAGKACEKKYTIAVRAVYTNLGGSFYVAYIMSFSLFNNAKAGGGVSGFRSPSFESRTGRHGDRVDFVIAGSINLIP